MARKRTRDAVHQSRPVDPAWDATCETTWLNLLARPESGGTFTAKQLFGALGVGYDRVRPVLDRAAADGRLVHVSARFGFTRPGLVSEAVTLKRLVTAAAQAVDPTAKGTAGRRATDLRERLDVLTPGQFARVRAAAAVAGRALGGERGLAGVGAEHFGWVPCAPNEPDRGTWTLVDVVARASDAEARAAHEASRDSGTWDSAHNDAARAAHTGGIRLLLNWSHTRGHIAGVTRLGADYGVHAAEVQPWVETMTETLSATARSQSTRYARADGVRVLALHRTRAKQLHDAAIDWARVIDSIEEAMYADITPLSPTKVTNAKGAYRALRRAGLVTGPGWGARADREPEGLVNTAAVKHAVRTGDFSAWRVPSARADGPSELVVPTTLVSADAAVAPHSLHRYYQWVDGRNSDAALALKALPERAYVDPDPQQAKKEIKARRKGKPLFANSTSTVGRNLNLLNAYIGWAARMDRVDFTRYGLEALVDADRFVRYCAHWQSLHPETETRNGRAAWLSQLGGVLGTIASPFLARTELMRGNTDRADALVALARTLFHHSLTLEPNDTETSSGKAKVAAWERRGDETEPVDRLRAIRDAMVEDIERLGRGSVREQIAAIRAGEYRMAHRPKWAALVRDAVILCCQCRIALRSGNLCALRHSGPRRTWFVGSHRAPWEGWITYAFSADGMKACEAFEATLISERDALTADACADLRPDLLELMLMPGGARDVLLSYRDGNATHVAPSDYVFVVRATYGGRSERDARVRTGCPMTVGSLNALFKRRIRDYARRVGLDPRAILTVYGAAAPHACRALVYTAAARGGDASAGARDLAHNNGTSTANAHYLGNRGATPDDIRRRRTGTSGCPTAASELIAQALSLVAAGKLSQEAYEATVSALQPPAGERAA